MPLYEYECDACAKRFERIQKFSDPPPEACPSCGGAVRKLLSSPAIQFKGSGWYITDYAKKTGGDGAKDSKGTASKDSDSGTGAKDSKTPSGSDSSASSSSSTSTGTSSKSEA
jgi:putative FmdB family regulatory protein